MDTQQNTQLARMVDDALDATSNDPEAAQAALIFRLQHEEPALYRAVIEMVYRADLAAEDGEEPDPDLLQMAVDALAEASVDPSQTAVAVFERDWMPVIKARFQLKVLYRAEAYINRGVTAGWLETPDGDRFRLTPKAKRYVKRHGGLPAW